jgi:hypothetical protein
MDKNKIIYTTQETDQLIKDQEKRREEEKNLSFFEKLTKNLKDVIKAGTKNK